MALKLEILNETNKTIDKLEPIETDAATATLAAPADCYDDGEVNETSELWDKWMLTIYRELNQPEFQKPDRKKTA